MHDTIWVKTYYDKGIGIDLMIFGQITGVATAQHGTVSAGQVRSVRFHRDPTITSDMLLL